LAFEMEKGALHPREHQGHPGQGQDALSRIDDGTYGMCDVCGEAIPVARLDALPYTKMCVNCASARR
jgi:RNA polymerase-binding transcription factor DksA